MINFKITSLEPGFLTIEKPSGKAISLKLGEIVKAQVMDILPSGGITLKIKGDFITAKTEVPLEKGAVAFFKVTDLPAEGKDLKLQFMSYETDKSETRSQKPEVFFTSNEGKVISKLLQELSNSLTDAKNINISKLQTLNSEILKVLPSDVNSLPKEVRMQLQNLLQASLKATGQSIQTRLENFINQLPEGVRNHTIVQNLTKDLIVNIEKLLQTPIKSVLQDTGVVLEAKLRSLVGFFDSRLSTLDASRSTLFDFDKDLKAGLLRLKELILGLRLTAEGDKGVTLRQDQGDIPSALSLKPMQAVRIIDGLIKDIETFQVLSKTTDSFYTFLPISWQELKDGEVSFKRGRSDAKGMSYSCRINLDLERFGKLSVMIMMYNKEFFVSFRVENSEFQAVLTCNASELQKSFSSRGLNLKAVNILDNNDTSLEWLERLESFERSISIKA